MLRSELSSQDFLPKSKRQSCHRRRWQEPTRGARSIPITANLRADYCLIELREVYLEILCTKTSVDNPLLAPSGHGGRKTFSVIEEGYWVEDEEGLRR